MRALKWLRELVEWRWAPFVGLVYIGLLAPLANAMKG